MLPKALMISLLGLIIALQAVAQKQNVYFLKNNGRRVQNRDSADYIRIVSEPDSGSTLFNIKEYYGDGKPKLVGKSTQVENDVFSGDVVSFHKSGKRQEIANYQKGRPIGDVYDYYPNGKLYTIKQYTKDYNPYDQYLYDGCVIKACNDSLGNERVIDGNGFYVGYDTGFKCVLEQGKLVGSRKDSVWTATVTTHNDPILPDGNNDTLTLTEKYSLGRLISGTCTRKNGDIFYYTQRQVNPLFPGGEDAFGHFLAMKIRYPQEARERKIQGKVYMQFVVEKDGSLSSIKAVRDPGGGLVAEGIRVLNLSPLWKCGVQYGIPVRVQFTVPINFSVGTRDIEKPVGYN